jgi:hypothetical protein
MEDSMAGRPRQTQSVPVLTADPVALSPDAFDELMDGLPEEQRNIRIDRLAGDPAAAPVLNGLVDVPLDKVMVTNLRYPEEKIFLPAVIATESGNRSEFVGQHSLQFINGRLLVTEEQADFIKRVCPYVHIEPSEGQVLQFTQTGFTTRSADVYQEYAARSADSQ